MIVDTEEMVLRFDAQAYLFALAFSVFVILMLFLMGWRSIRRTNIIDIVQESHKSEPIRAVPRWYGPVGVLPHCIGRLPGVLHAQLFRQSSPLVCPLRGGCTVLPACTDRPVHSSAPHRGQWMGRQEKNSIGT